MAMITICWLRQGRECVDLSHRVLDALGWPRGFTVNRETRVECTEEQLDMLRDLECQGLVQLRNKD